MTITNPLVIALIGFVFTILQALFLFILNGIRSDIHDLTGSFAQHLRDHATGKF